MSVRRFFCVAALIIIAGCSFHKDIEVTIAGDEEINAKVGQKLFLDLDSNPTTGYSWGVVEESGNSVLKKDGEKEYAPKSDLIGSGGVETFSFSCSEPGNERLVFYYRRPWETNKSPLKAYKVNVSVK